MVRKHLHKIVIGALLLFVCYQSWMIHFYRSETKQLWGSVDAYKNICQELEANNVECTKQYMDLATKHNLLKQSLWRQKSPY